MGHAPCRWSNWVEQRIHEVARQARSGSQQKTTESSEAERTIGRIPPVTEARVIEIKTVSY
jgi:hypothetical protein